MPSKHLLQAMNSSYVTLQLNNKPFFVKCVVDNDMCQMALFTVLKYNTQFFFFCMNGSNLQILTLQRKFVPGTDPTLFFSPFFFVSAEDGSKHAAVYSRQPRLFPIPEPGGASLHHAPHRHHPVCFWEQPVANLQRGMIAVYNVVCLLIGVPEKHAIELF